MVGHLYPNRAVFATTRDSKGADDEAVNRSATFFNESGLPSLVYKTNQEHSLKAAIGEALRRTGSSMTFEAFQAVPENSAVGDSAANGGTGRAVLTIEDMLRTLISALEARIKSKFPMVETS